MGQAQMHMKHFQTLSRKKLHIDNKKSNLKQDTFQPEMGGDLTPGAWGGWEWF